LSTRELQRRFSRYLGVGPKWVLQRYRLHEAAERIAAGGRGDWAGVAAELGYADQAHFIRDFRAVVGCPPGAYAAACAHR
jgi:AraC-like DNA-binding protein